MRRCAAPSSPGPICLSDSNDVRTLFQPRSKMPQICRSVAGLEGYSQQALQRIGCVRKTFASSFAAVKRKSVCAQIKLQMVSEGAAGPLGAASEAITTLSTSLPVVIAYITGAPSSISLPHVCQGNTGAQQILITR